MARKDNTGEARPKVVSLSAHKHDPTPEEIARLLRAVDEGRPVHELPGHHGHTTLKRATSRLSTLAGTPKIDGDLAATFECAAGAMQATGEREAKLLRATLWRCLHGKTLPKGEPQKATHKRVLRGGTYLQATAFADTFCDPTARLDVIPETRELAGRAFKELAALVGVAVPEFAWTPRAWKKTRAAFVEAMRAVRLTCEAEGLKDVPHHSQVFDKLDMYSRAGVITNIAAWLGYTMWAYVIKEWYGEDDYNGAFRVDAANMADRLEHLAAAIHWAAEIERYGAEAVRRAVECREQLKAEAVAAALASVPDASTLLRETGTPDIDVAFVSELGGEWEKFIAEEGGAA